jgi:hypothetical protein
VRDLTERLWKAVEQRHVRPLVERGEGTTRSAVTCLSGTKSKRV